MRVVAGAEGHEAEQTPQAAARTPQTAAQTAQVPEQAPEAAQGAAPTTEQSSVTTDHAARSSEQQTPEAESPVEQVPPAPGFGERGRMRRRARFLRKARELAYRDLGGLVFDLHRFGQRNDPLVLAKLATLRELDTELRGLEDGLRQHRPVTVLREVGIAACPRCAAIHGSDDRFCPGCGLAFDANADRPISTAPVAPQVQGCPRGGADFDRHACRHDCASLDSALDASPNPGNALNASAEIDHPASGAQTCRIPTCFVAESP